jgi:uncharacterized protein YeaO (DUF488 family)
MKLSNYQYFSKRRRGEGLRIGCTRYLVRGQRKASYSRKNIFDVWLPTLAPSQKLLRHFKRFDSLQQWTTFDRRYRNEMKRTNPRQVIRTLAKLAKKTPLAIGCYCGGSRCHRFILEKLIRAAAVGKF